MSFRSTTMVVASIVGVLTVREAQAQPHMQARAHVQAQAQAQAQPSADTIRRIGEASALVTSLGAAHGPSIWPGFRPDTIPRAYVLLGRGTLLFGWRGALPAGYSAVTGEGNVGWQVQSAPSAASTSIAIDQRAVAQIAVYSLDPADLVPVTFHEAFHVYEGAQRKAGRRFAAGENASLFGSYPLFDLPNETAFMMEGRVLAAALRAHTVADKRARAQEFVGIRRARHRVLDHDMADFDQAAELNEGLAEYALVRALDLMVASGPPASREAASRQLASKVTLLETLTSNHNNSLRLRYYQTGMAIARLLDALAGDAWKARVMADDLTLQDMLAQASGVDAVAVEARARAERRLDVASARRDAAANIAALQAMRHQQADSALALPGIRVTLRADSLPSRRFNKCGFDPQNLLLASATLELQARWWKACSGGPTYGEFTGTSVYDAEQGTVRAVVGPESELAITVDGAAVALPSGQRLENVRAFKLVTSHATITCVRADVWRDGRDVYIVAKTP